MKKTILFLIIFVFLFSAGTILAHQPRIVYSQSGIIQVSNPDISQAFYDELNGQPRNYSITSDKDFELYINLLVPAHSNITGRYSANIFLINGETKEEIASIDSNSVEWEQFYEKFARDYYLKGPELTKQVSAGIYEIEVFSEDNLGKYVFVVGKKEYFDTKSVLNIYWQVPLLKLKFFQTSVWQFLLTPFGIAAIGVFGVLLIFIFFIYYLIGVIKAAIKHREAKTMLLTSGGMLQMQDEIIKLLQKPAYDVTVGFINTARKYRLEDDPGFVDQDLQIMKNIGFNVETIDIDGKKEHEVAKLLETKDIVFVGGGNTFYLLKAMRACNFEKILRRLMKNGKVYIGVSAGSIVAGKTIKTAGWKNADKNIVGLKNLKGLHLVPFDIFVHYTPEWEETIKKEMPNQKKRAKTLKIITDEQAILVQGREVDLIGDGEAIII